jgi:hypothetical protein
MPFPCFLISSFGCNTSLLHAGKVLARGPQEEGAIYLMMMTRMTRMMVSQMVIKRVTRRRGHPAMMTRMAMSQVMRRRMTRRRGHPMMMMRMMMTRANPRMMRRMTRRRSHRVIR